MDKGTNSGRLGTFTIGSVQTPGLLVLNGQDSYLRMYSDVRLHGSEAGKQTVGTLHDGTNVSLIKCVPTRLINSLRNGKPHSELEVFPNYVVEGSIHIDAVEASIRSITVFAEDATSLFYDFDAFGSVLTPGPVIQDIDARGGLSRPLPIGPEPQIAYFAGQREIISVETEVGTFRANHCPSFPLGGPQGVSIKNEISITLEFDELVTFDVCLDRRHRLLSFLELILGRQQVVRRQYVGVESAGATHTLAVHWSHSPQRVSDRHDDHSDPQPADLLVMAVEDKNGFARLLANWLASDAEMRQARQRFHTLFVKDNRFSLDRLVGIANAFDLLPESSVDSQVTVSAELAEATRVSRESFKSLPTSYERNTVLAALGRVGRPSLKHKVRRRADAVLAAAPQRFRHLHDVVDEAINCRNYFVHGTTKSVASDFYEQMYPFFTNTLEFVFGASDLIECGWDFGWFVRQGTTGSHPFGSFKVNFDGEASEFLSLREAAKPVNQEQP